MIELRGLHLGNIARSPAESVRPDLWPDHAWVPALGVTGGALFDIVGNKPCSHSMGWEAPGILKGTGTGYANTGEITNRYTGLTVIANGILSGINSTLISRWNSNTTNRSWGIYRDALLSMRAALSTNGAYNKGQTAEYLASDSSFYDKSRVYGLRWQSVVQGKGQLWIDGEMVAQAVDECTSIYSSSWPIHLGGFYPGAYNLDTSGRIRTALVYYKGLSAQQMLDIYADSLLPFRRRRRIFYSVPSSGTARSLIAALSGESTTSIVAATMARALRGDLVAASVTGAITASMARALLANVAGTSTTSTATALLERLLLAAVTGESTTAAPAATLARALSGTIAGQSITGDVTATLAALIELIASISGTTTTPSVAATIGRALSATVAGQSVTGAVAAQFAGMLLLVASITGTSTTGALTATTTRELRAAIAAASASGQVDGQLLRQIAATVSGASVTGPIAAELANLVSLAASVVGASITPDVVAALQRGLAADVAAESTTGAAAVTVARTLAAAVEAGSLTPDNLVLILTGLGILHDTTIISRTPRRGITSRTVRRTIHSA